MQRELPDLQDVRRCSVAIFESPKDFTGPTVNEDSRRPRVDDIVRGHETHLLVAARFRASHDGDVAVGLGKPSARKCVVPTH